MEPKYKNVKRRDLVVYAELFHTARCLMNNGIDHVTGSAHQFRASIIFFAFTLEAFLNHVGVRLIEDWIKSERNLSPFKKIETIASKVGVTVEWAERPWSTAKTLFETRNHMAHGKDSVIEEIRVLDESEDFTNFSDLFAKSDWEKFCTKENTEVAKTDVKKMATLLGVPAGISEIELFRTGFQTRSQSATKNLKNFKSKFGSEV